MTNASALASYAQAVLYIATPSGTVRVRPAPYNQCRGEFPGTEGQILHIITACNPGGAIVDADQNAAAQARLERELSRRGLTWWPASGGDAAWSHVEPSAAVAGLSRASAIELGRQFGQDAVFELSPAGRYVVGCQDRSVHASGWLADFVSDDHPETSRPFDGRQADLVVPARAEPPERAGTSRKQAHEQARLPCPEDCGAPGGYLSTLARRPGVLMSLEFDGVPLAVRGDGSGLVWIDGLAGEPARRCQPAEALRILAAEGVFDWDDGPIFQSAGWDAGEVAAMVAPWFDLDGGGGGEFMVDDIGMLTDGHGRADVASPEDAEALMLDHSAWELDGSGGSPGNSESGQVYLLSVGPRYVSYQCSGGEVIADELCADSDQEAVSRFRADFPDA